MQFSQIITFKTGWTVFLILICANVVLAQTKTKSSESTNIHSAPPQAESWSVFRGNAESTGVATSSLPDQLEVLWEFAVPQGAFEGSAAIVADQKTPTQKSVYIADLDGKVFAFDLESGEKRWEFTSEIGFVTSPAVNDGRIYLGDLDGVFYCIDEEGNKRWSHATDAEINGSANFYKHNVLVGSQDSHLYAFNMDSGEVDWKYESKDQIRCSATVAGNRAFVAGCDGYFHVVNLDDGTEIGNTDIKSPTGATPAAQGNRVFFGTESGDFFAVDWKKINNEWTFAEPQSGNSIRSCAAVTEGHVVFGARNRNVYSLNPKTGEKNWVVRLKAKIDSSPVIVGERVFVASTDGRLYALSLSNGEMLWEKQFNGGIISSPVVAFGKLVIATDRGVVYCLGEK
jgi:outer membrane protein assembly factor BamB